MSRIQDILSKAERDGTARRTRAIADESARPPIGVSPQPARESAAAAAGREAPARPAPSRGAATAVVEPAARVATSVRLDAHLVAALAPHSLAAEQYRSLRTRIARAENGRAIRAIVVTSPAKGDGKSLTASNLALTMAQEFQQRVLLVDADLRRPSLQQLFGLPAGPGLSDVLTGAADVADALVALPDTHMTILPAGTPPHHPAELLGSASMRRVLDTLRTRFDRIVIDMPPAAPLADVQIVSPMADAVLLIVRAAITPKPAIERALGGLEASKVLGLVLNESGRTGDAKAYAGYGYIAG
jgi:protein-tyrosine kinase